MQYKIQLFIHHEGDHYRNRLTHSTKVSTAARSLAKTLNMSSDLAETIVLAHDFGHTAFGHAGEVALNKCIHDYSEFSLNAHSLKILNKVEKRFDAYDGLNLTWNMLEGIVKQNGPLINNIPTYIASFTVDISQISHDLEDSKLFTYLIADSLLQTNNNLPKQKIITNDDLSHLD